MKHLTQEQRYIISTLLQTGITQKSIAELIGKDKSIISREISRNKDLNSGVYKPDLAQRKHTERQKSKHKHVYFTEEVKLIVHHFIEKDYSPEQIVGYCKRVNLPHVSVERIYQYIWEDKKHKGDLHKHLRRNGRKNRKRGSSKESRSIIKEKVNISERPAIVNEKTRIGDLEIDTIIGKNHNGAILTINDRVTKQVFIKKLAGKNAKELTEKTIKLLYPLKDKIKTITSDNGTEFADFKTIQKTLNIQFYFADPYCSWQRGANENTNGLIRQYIKKGSSFEEITDEFIQEIETKLNNRPRKTLNYLTPNEFFNLYSQSG